MTHPDVTGDASIWLKIFASALLLIVSLMFLVLLGTLIFPLWIAAPLALLIGIIISVVYLAWPSKKKRWPFHPEWKVFQYPQVRVGVIWCMPFLVALSVALPTMINAGLASFVAKFASFVGGLLLLLGAIQGVREYDLKAQNPRNEAAITRAGEAAWAYVAIGAGLMAGYGFAEVFPESAHLVKCMGELWAPDASDVIDRACLKPFEG